tara:strand:+ start:1288 stop:2265 length:978 start_codon:yes stop_codon:yes gene_type:complete
MTDFSVNDDNSDENIYNPYNPINKEISLIELQTILRSYGLPTTVHNIEYYKLAFVHHSYTFNNTEDCSFERPSNCVELKPKSNERLEFLGDGILEAIIKFYLYKRFPEENEGFMTEKKIALVKNESIGKLAYDMKLNKWLLLSVSAEEKKNRSNYKKLGCLFEAFLGAMFLDFNEIPIHDEDKWFQNIFLSGPGFQLVQIFMENVLEQHINWFELINSDVNFKNKLQMIIQKEFKTTPDYLEFEKNYDGYNMGVFLCIGMNIHNLSHNDAMIIHSGIENKFEYIKDILNQTGRVFVFLGSGKHKIKRKAEMTACENALIFINGAN